jgi:HSP90 family molecular chaperone
MEWRVDIKELLTLLGKTIYRPENVLVELAANSYDADASKVEIVSSGESKMIQIKDDGCGMDLSDIDELITVAKSKKRKMLENEETTPIYNRKLLGCFGIGIISFLSLGNIIRIFTCREDCTPIFLSYRKTCRCRWQTN